MKRKTVENQFSCADRKKSTHSKIATWKQIITLSFGTQFFSYFTSHYTIVYGIKSGENVKDVVKKKLEIK